MMKKEYFNIPNLLGYFRILMIPVFLFLYYRADTNGEYIAAFLVLAVIYLTDFFDGKITYINFLISRNIIEIIK